MLAWNNLPEKKIIRPKIIEFKNLRPIKISIPAKPKRANIPGNNGGNNVNGAPS